ncbi:hypothetical protein AGABI1DRAFT_79361 [Agaricus bisporus var. burnettii JB137-S8]|uniref:Uncharacterized protein n=1 Tax=Agaricus bisporus var. burnettii (strain JB137-S8 / ATCC MYA-4627 / FGSC 10392) TaxID=597362 RepID=K5VMX5_AGABU|nr:uncharacterized protein AGABI1DRAFT_79361 [Agaricus bisporus var. burnettii JB137-S8]EKM75804.1 hypothetical protein AGABI1DRAFT_79361 [Agaricus bisporus var. burnettii JB137-S8]
MSSYESLRAAGTSVICLSPWGDSSPLFLPCIRFRDLAIHTVIAATGGMAAVAAPAMGPISDVVLTSFGDTIFVELGLHAGFELSAKAANDLVFDRTAKELIPIHSERLETDAVKVLLITLKHKHTMEDAALGFYRSSLHKDISLFSSIKDYLAIEKGWFSPYLFASARRPIIPRSMKPDVVFCHGPFLSGDYRIGETLLAESASIITLCDAPAPPEGNEKEKEEESHLDLHSLSTALKSHFSRSRTPSPDPKLTSLPQPPAPRRLVVLVLGLKPHRKFWTTSARPGESVINYMLFNGCPAIVIPVKTGAPLVAWYGNMTLEQLWQVELPEKMESGTPTTEAPKQVDEDEKGARTFTGTVQILFEYLDLCVDWNRVNIPSVSLSGSENASSDSVADALLVEKKKALRDSLALLVSAAIQSGRNKEVAKEVDEAHGGIAMWRIP